VDIAWSIPRSHTAKTKDPSQRYAVKGLDPGTDVPRREAGMPEGSRADDLTGPWGDLLPLHWSGTISMMRRACQALSEPIVQMHSGTYVPTWAEARIAMARVDVPDHDIRKQSGRRR